MIDVERAWEYLLAQSALGPRHAGSPGHAAAQQLLFGWLTNADWRREHAFEGTYFGKPVTCKNLWGHYAGDEPGRILLGSHFDTRPWADNDPDVARRQDPVPGANDGASGIALLAAMDGFLRDNRARRSVDLVFFDAEDWHDIDGHSVSEGSKRFVADLAKEDRPDEVIIVDMVAGSSLMLDADVTCQDHEPSYALTLKLFQLGNSLGLPAFTLKKPSPYKWIGCDHTPFMAAGIASAILIDIDYPPWHTVDDLPEHCSRHSLAQVARVLEAYILGS
jgi:glutaminyl-peptide cyclotransferase